MSRRGRQLVDGKEAKIKTDEKSPITISALELSQDKYAIQREDEEMS